MPNGFNPNHFQEVIKRLQALGVDNLNLFVNEQGYNCLDVGWKDLRVRGIGVDAEAAATDADIKIRAAIATAYPLVVLPT